MSKKPEALTPPKIGEEWKGHGGILGALIRGINGEPDYYLIVSPIEGHKTGLEWGGYGKEEKAATCEYNGEANTAALVKSKIAHPAAEFCSGFKHEGHADYFLPSRREIRALWVNVPELFESGWYWTSTQDSDNNAWGQGFDVGYQLISNKGYQGRVRAVRRLLAIQ